MGLGAPKSRNKLSHDPNNNAWARSTENYGHRILASQGWKTGDYLGAHNASHADHYTPANASHIRVLLREDNLGLGAKVGGKANAESFGLSTLSGIFGRLNGKSDVDVQKQQSKLRDAELRTYQAQKYGFMNFVRGGLLVGDKIEDLPHGVLPAKSGGAVEEGKASKKRKAAQEAPTTAERDGSKKKRRAVVPDGTVDEVAIPDVEERKKKRKERRREEQVSTTEARPVDDDDAEPAAKRVRKEQRRVKRAACTDESTTVEDEKARLKQERRARKEERRKRKEKKRRHKAAEHSSDEEPVTVTTTAASSVAPTPAISEVTSGMSTPIQGAPGLGGGRSAIRQRYIMQKRLASMDPKALNEILMVKAQG